MKLSLPLLAVVAGLLAGGGAGSYWYLAQAGTTGEALPVVPNDAVFIDMERKFVVPLVEGSRVRSMPLRTCAWRSGKAPRSAPAI
jgi:hypothetical protein